MTRDVIPHVNCRDCIVCCADDPVKLQRRMLAARSLTAQAPASGGETRGGRCPSPAPGPLAPSQEAA